MDAADAEEKANGMISENADDRRREIPLRFFFFSFRSLEKSTNISQWFGSIDNFFHHLFGAMAKQR